MIFTTKFDIILSFSHYKDIYNKETLVTMGLIPKKTDLTPVWDKKPPIKRVYTAKSKKTSTSKLKLYRNKVSELTEEVKHLIEGVEKRGWHKYHIDHKISVKWGFENNIPEECIAHPDNLRMLWWEDNLSKNTICEVDDKNQWILWKKKL